MNEMPKKSKQIVLGCRYHWWRGDTLPELQPLPGFVARIIRDNAFLAQLHESNENTIQARFAESAHCYVAFLEEIAVGYGWVGTKVGHIGSADLHWRLGEQDRALWDFATLPHYRGRGVYPHLLQAIMQAEPAERFWIGHQGQNKASHRGIVKAGFSLNNMTLLTFDGQIVMQPQGDLTRAMADPMLPAAKAHSQNMPEAARQQLLQLHAHKKN